MNKKNICIFGIILIGILLLRYRDYYYVEINDSGYTELYEEADKELYKGLVASAGNIQLKKGMYYLTIDFHSWGNDNYFEVVDTFSSDGTKVYDRILYSSPYEIGVGQNVYKIVLEESVSNFVINSYQEDGKLKIYSYKLESATPYYSDTYFFVCLWILLFLIFIWKHQWLCSKEAYPFWILCGVSVCVSIPLFTDFLSGGHDIVYHLQRIKGITESLRIGDQFPVRVNMVINKGYGFLNPVMYPELFLYLPGILGVLGVSLLISLKFFLVLINICTAFISYYSLKTLTNKRLALTFSIIYVMSPYRLNNLYIRFALGEFLAMTFLPLFFVGVYHIVLENDKKWWMAAVGCSCVLQSHLLTTEMSVFLTAIFVLLNLGFLKNFRRVLQALKAILVTVLLNLWYIVPLLQFMGGGFDLLEDNRYLGENGVYFGEMFSTIFSPENDKVIGSTYHDMSLSIGIAIFIGVIIFLIYQKQISEKNEFIRKSWKNILTLGLVAMYMASWLFPWKLVYKNEVLSEFFGIIQFSWRFLIFVTFFLSLITSFALEWCCEHKKFLAGVIILCLSYSVLEIENGYIFNVESVMNNKYSQVHEDYSYDYFYKEDYDLSIFENRGNIITIEPECNVSILNYNKKGTSLEFDFKILEKTNAQEYSMIFPYYNYGFYGAWVNGEKIPVFSNQDELVSIELESSIEQGHVEIRYIERNLYKLCDVISIGTLVAGIVYWIIKTVKLKRDQVCGGYAGCRKN